MPVTETTRSISVRTIKKPSVVTRRWWNPISNYRCFTIRSVCAQLYLGKKIYVYIHIVSTVADSAVSVSWSLSRATLFATSHLLAITVIHVRPSSRTGQRASLDDIIIMGGTGDRDYHTYACVVSTAQIIQSI